MVATVRVADKHESFNRIRQVAPTCKVPWSYVSRPLNSILICSHVVAQFISVANTHAQTTPRQYLGIACNVGKAG